MPTEETQVEELTERNATGKMKQQEQKKLRSSSKAVKNTVPTEDTQVEELTEQIKSTFHSKFPPNYYIVFFSTNILFYFGPCGCFEVLIRQY